MEKGTTYVALDDSKRKTVAGILRPGATAPELRELPNDAHHIRRLFERLTREGPVVACYEAGVSGYDLYRQITALGVPCQVIAPALTVLLRCLVDAEGGDVTADCLITATPLALCMFRELTGWPSACRS